MPRPAKLDDTALPKNSWVLYFIGLCVRLNTYTRKHTCKDFCFSYTKFKRVISGVWQKGGSYYNRLEHEQEKGEDKAPKRKCKA